MIKFYVSKSVKSDFIITDDVSINLNSLRLTISNSEKPDIFAFPLSYFRNNLWMKKDICQFGIFEDVDGVKGAVAFNNISINFFYPCEKGVQVLDDNNGLVSIIFDNLKTKAFIDSKNLSEFSPVAKDVNMSNVEYIADNGVIFSLNKGLYHLIF